MSLKGKYIWFNSLRLGGKKAISFELTNSAWFGQEVFNAALVSGDGMTPPMHYLQQVLKHGETLRFNYDTVDWNWKQGDSFVILDKNGKIIQSWPLNLSTYAVGECPECHGTHRCKTCQGRGVITDYHTHMVSSCQVCHGTGVCQTCYIPTSSTSPQNVYATSAQPGSARYREQRKAMLREQIADLQNKIDKMERDAYVQDMHDAMRPWQKHSYSVTTANSSLKFSYEQALIKARSELEQLEMMDLNV